MFRSPSQFFEKNLHQVMISLKKLKHSNKSEEFHRLRVSIKKIRAMISMVEETGGPTIRAQQLEKVFQDAGLIREYRINIRLLEKYKMQHANVMMILRKDVAKSEKNFRSRITKYITELQKLQNEKKLKELSWPDNKKLKKFFDRRISELSKKKVNSRKKLHQYRMRLKRIMYVYDALSPTRKKIIGLNSKGIDHIQNKVGKWHDLYSATELIKDLDLERKKLFSSIVQKEKKEFKYMMPHLKIKISGRK